MRFDGNLQGYMLYFIRQKLRQDLQRLAEDIRQECVLAIIEQKNLTHLQKYIKSNEIPEGRDLSLLKAIMFRQRLKWIEIETRRDMVPYRESWERDDG